MFRSIVLAVVVLGASSAQGQTIKGSCEWQAPAVYMRHLQIDQPHH